MKWSDSPATVIIKEKRVRMEKAEVNSYDFVLLIDSVAELVENGERFLRKLKIKLRLLAAVWTWVELKQDVKRMESGNHIVNSNEISR